MNELTDAQIDVLHDMAEEWADRDRHGELDYDEVTAAAWSTLHETIRDLAKARGIIYG